VNWRKCAAFTLIELLVVIGIMAARLALSIPAFQGLGRGSGMQTAIAELRSTLALARQYAIAHRITTCVVFPDGEDSIYNASPGQVEKAFKSYAVYYKAPEGTYKRLGEWKTLPPGVVFDNVFMPPNSSGTPSPYKNLLTTPDNSIIPNVEFPVAGTYESLIGIGFKPDGAGVFWSDTQQAFVGGNPIHVIISEGWPENVNTNAGTVNDQPFVKNERIIFSVEVATLTGQLKVKEHKP
jgi:prepilin-type N-terminal cleavage/methylation domain-containing protein